MAQLKITYEDKTNPVPIVDRTQQATAADFNQIKQIVNNNADDVVNQLATKPDASTFYTRTALDAGQLDNRYYTEAEVDTLLANVPQASTFYTRTALDGGQLDNRYYTETELNNGQLDSRYYTEAELDAGQLDNRYYTEDEIDSMLSATGSVTRRRLTDVTIGATYAIDWNSLNELLLNGTISSNVTFTYTNVSNAEFATLHIAISGAARTLTFPDTTIGEDDRDEWSASAHTLTLPVGSYTLVISKVGTEYRLAYSQALS